ncbi:MAG: AAA family ATPase [Methylobacter sp.]|nr:MAG: AAA family ATPase [Methylobacter sp.]
MKNWKISKLQIQGFKAFSRVDFDFDTCSLLTLEGPNGYGKTTVFDAIELIFTGGISRISHLCNTVMSGKKKNYKDNLYWNTKYGETVLKIKMEMVSSNGDKRITFARVATIEDLKNQANNKADQFDIFKLYLLSDFDSETLGDVLPSDHLDTYFGDNFGKNYSMLNYLQQGQSTFIFANNITERKGALEDLLKIRETKDQIELCSKIEKRLASMSSTSEKLKISELEAKVEQLSKIDLSEAQDKAYEKLSTFAPAPGWDQREPFVQHDEPRYQTFLAELNLLIEVLKHKEEIRIIRKNSEIERYITQNDKLITLAVSIGKHFGRYDDLNVQNLRLISLVKALSTLKKSPNSITSEDFATLKTINVTVDSNLDSYISSRDILLKQLNGRSAQVVELKRVRADLFTLHQQAFEENGTWCALCGTEWDTVERLAAAIDETTKVYDAEIGVLATQLADIHKFISDALEPVTASLILENELLEKSFERNLYIELGANINHFDALKLLNDRLTSQQIEYSEIFSNDAVELDSRKADLIARIRALKQAEGVSPPPDGWDSAIIRTFATYEDFYNADFAKYAEKISYITLKHRNQQNATLQDSKKELLLLQRKLSAVIAAKTKVSKLKTLLIKTEREYSARIISNIELIFHIYSGRLIQNYQRGLGLFIDRGDGNKLQFSTAEQSEHDASLSMSSGQLSALSLAFFLSLNRVYSENTFVLIDDPAQSLDEINIASLTDLLRCEFQDRQLIISSHEDDIAAYIRYRFKRAGLTQKPFHMQSHVESNFS